MLAFNDGVKRAEGVPAFQTRPVVFTNEIDTVRLPHKRDISRELLDQRRVKVIREDIDLRHGEVGFINAISAVDDEFVRGEGFDQGGDFLGPGVGNVHVAEGGAAEFVAGFVHGDGGVLGVGEAGVGVFVGEEVGDVVFEVLDYGCVGVKLHYEGVTGGEVLVWGGFEQVRRVGRCTR